MSTAGGPFTSQDGSGPPNKRARISDGPDSQTDMNPLDNLFGSTENPSLSLPDELLPPQERRFRPF